LADRSLADFSLALLQWVQGMLPARTPLTAAPEGTTSCQGWDPAGKPVHLIKVFVHELKVALGQWSDGDEKSNEPVWHNLLELFANFPMLRRITGDALVA